jgi:predicted permease
MRILIKVSLPAGLFILLVHNLVSRLVTIPDTIAMPMMIVSILLMMIGIFYHGWCFGKGKSPYDLRKKK